APLFRRLLRWGLLVGLPLNAVSATLFQLDVQGGPLAGGVAFWLASAVQAVGAPGLMPGSPARVPPPPPPRTPPPPPPPAPRPPGGVLARLAPMCRPSLTCFLSSSLLLTLVFYGFGLGLYGRTGPATDLLVGVVVYLVLVLFATVYVRFFRYGPAEWLWRSLTYGRRQPMLLPAAGYAGSRSAGA